MKHPILDHRLVSERYFFPRQEFFDNPFWVQVDVDIRLACYYQEVSPTAPTIVFFHGNGEIVPDYMGLFPPIFNAWGYNCLLAEYRGYGMSQGVPMLGQMLNDVGHIINALPQDPENIIVFGRSVGSIYAVHAVELFPQIKGLILESGIADVSERIFMRAYPGELGTDHERFKEAFDTYLNHEKKLNNYKGNTLVLHTKNDSLVRAEHGINLHKWSNEPKQLLLFEEGGHNDILLVNTEAYMEGVRRFLEGLG